MSLYNKNIRNKSYHDWFLFEEAIQFLFVPDFNFSMVINKELFCYQTEQKAKNMKPTNMQPHPEGGKFKEVYRSLSETQKDTVKRSALTHIYFSLESNEVSHFHRVTSDEVWNLYRGDGIYLYLWDGTDTPPQRIEISSKANCFCYVVPAGYWQATEPIGGAILVGCSVAPGFDFDDFSMISHESPEAKRLLSGDSTMVRFIPKGK